MPELLFGRGAMTNGYTGIKNTDMMLIRLEDGAASLPGHPWRVPGEGGRSIDQKENSTPA